MTRKDVEAHPACAGLNRFMVAGMLASPGSGNDSQI